MIELHFADGEYSFALGLAQINEIEKKCECGLGAVFGRLLRGRYITGPNETVGAPADAVWKIADLIEVIRQGLLGGIALGKTAAIDGVETKITGQRVNELIQNYVLGKPLSEAWTLAVAILSASIEGYDTPKKARPDVAPAKPRKRKASSAKMDTQEPSSTAG